MVVGYLLTVVSSFRSVPGFLADRIGRFNILIASALLAGVVTFCWTTATSVAGVVVWAVAYGFVSGVRRCAARKCDILDADLEM